MLKGRGGFTLIELAVTMAVMAIIIGLAVVNIGSSSKSVIGREAKKLAFFMELVHDDAVTRGERMGVSFKGNTPLLWHDSGKDWVQTAGDNDVGDGTVENGVKISGVWVDGHGISGSERVEFNPSGSIAPYSVKLTLDGMETELKGDIFGRVAIKEKPAEAKTP
jgi:type II secretion system protein H